MRRRTVVRAITELQSAGYVRLIRPRRRVRQSVQAVALALRLADFANDARNLCALGSAQRLDSYATRLAAAPTQATLRIIAAALVDDAAHADVSASEDPYFASLNAVWTSAADLAAHPRRLNHRRQRWTSGSVGPVAIGEEEAPEGRAPAVGARPHLAARSFSRWRFGERKRVHGFEKFH